ncbi:aromatic acid exporter family protein [Paenibacillus sp. FA6]|uniref:aromatic acid exporter family protein n=1 Tax=Paenibacillus sp. FA6 TaxID=3413029 RepID=UPI003F658D42
MGIRVIKTAIATLMSILIADMVGIPSPQGAGLLAILGVEVTRKRSLRTISARFFASIVGLLFACMLFAVFGFHYWVLGLFVLFGFPLIVKTSFKEGIVTSSVVVFRIFGGEDLSFPVLLTQVELLVIGLGSAMVVNMIYMPKVSEQMIEIRHKVDGLFAVIFKHISRTLHDPSYIWDGSELIEASKAIAEGSQAANRAMENQMLHPDAAWNIYFYMRKEQLDLILVMVQRIADVYQKLPQGELVAELMEQLSHDVTETEYTGRTEMLLEKLEQDFKEMDLPTNREEFEIRSSILQLCRELSLYLKIAKKSKAPIPEKLTF